MSIVKETEEKYRSNPNHGVTFCIEESAYDCRLGDRVTFGEAHVEMQCGTMFNWQDIFLDGKYIGVLQESQSGKIFDPMCASFCVHLADCSEHELWEEMSERHKGNRHLDDSGEVLQMKFATLNQLLDFLKAK